MGCGSSANNKVHVVQVSTTDTTVVNEPATDTKTGRKSSAGKRRRVKMGTGQGGQGSQESLGNSGEDRGQSATSKASQHSMDSGYVDAEYARVITEFSQADQVNEVEQSFTTPRNLDLGVRGKAVSQRSSAQSRAAEEQSVLADLRQEGLIQKPVSKAASGLSFDIVADDSLSAPRRPPARLAKLEKRRKKRKEMTEEEIKEKLLRAEQRKKEQEEQKLAKIASLNKSDVLTALDTFTARQQQQEETQKTREDLVNENREKRLKEMRDKLKAKQEYADAVRRRKKMEPIQINDSPD